MSAEKTLPPPILGGYPTEPDDVEWPRETWPRGAVPDGVDLAGIFDAAFDADGPLATTHAALVVHRGRIVADSYAGALGSFIGEPTPIRPTTPLLSWSMAKSLLAVLLAMVADERAIDLDAAPSVPEWSDADDPRRAITWRNLLEMRDGLDFVEDYTDEGRSDVIEMLFGSGKADCAHFAADRPLLVEPGALFNYSSGTSNIVSRSLGDLLGGEAVMRAALEKRIFAPLSMRSATPTFDEAGTFLASSYVHATAEDFARFGLFLCRGGVVSGERLLRASWIDTFRTPVSLDEDGSIYSAHFWVLGDPYGSFYASGFEGQSITVCPALDLVIVRLGSTPTERKEHLLEWRRRIIDAFGAAPERS